MDVGWLASGPLSCQQLEMRDGDKSKLRDKGILKAVLNTIPPETNSNDFGGYWN